MEELPVQTFNIKCCHVEYNMPYWYVDRRSKVSLYVPFSIEKILLALMSAHSILVVYLGRFYVRLKFACMIPPAQFFRKHYFMVGFYVRSKFSSVHRVCAHIFSPPLVARYIWEGFMWGQMSLVKSNVLLQYFNPTYLHCSYLSGEILREVRGHT